MYGVIELTSLNARSTRTEKCSAVSFCIVELDENLGQSIKALHGYADINQKSVPYL